MLRRSPPLLAVWLGLICLLAPAAVIADSPRVQPASHPTLAAADLPPLIPAETFFSTRQESWDHKISPDGTKLL